MSWHKTAHDDLARIWLDSSDRRSVEMAANAIDRILKADASQKGSPIPDDLRQLTIPPLLVLFAVSEPDRIVRILDVTEI